MADPPFPPPRGMRWSPTRKRFFKLDAAQAEVKQPPPLEPASKRLRRSPPIPPSAFAQPGSSAAFVQTARSSLPRSSTLRNAAMRPKELRIAHTVALLPTCVVAPLVLLELWTSPSYPGILFNASRYNTGRQEMPLLEESSSESIRWFIDNEPQATLKRCFFAQDDCQSWHAPDRLVLSRMSLTSTQQIEQTMQQSMACPEPEGGIIGVLHAAPLEGPVVVVRWSHTFLELFRWGHSSRIIKRDKSDFLTCAVSRDGRFVYAGRRDGQLRRWACDAVLPPGAKGALIELPARCEVPYAPTRSEDRGEPIRVFKGAVTAIKCVGEELVVATSSGELERLDASGALLQSYHGHVSTWSLDLPLALSTAHRLLAARGQDDVLRAWSLEHPLPIASLKLEPGEAASAEPDRMVFCEGARVRIALARGAQILIIQ